MANSDEYIRRAIRALEAERQGAIQQLRVIDVKIAQLTQALHQQPPAPASAREPGESAGRGEAEREILSMLETEALTAAEIAKRRGTSNNAASNILRRLYQRGDLDLVARGRYARKGGAQASLVEGESTG
jgi:Arc/MetJ-type ribon-helix-helix transcriptional regulator